ncbi:hypothetical protein GCM10028790_20270 [Micromonospora taraxaci]|nr:hypothetical protein [Micromonospora taraxaci]
MDALERAMDRLRHRWPLQFTVAGAGGWALVVITYFVLVYENYGDFVQHFMFIGILPLLLLGTVAVWGLDRVPWPVWPCGVTPLVVGATAAPSNPSRSLIVSTVITVMVFVYAQLFLLTLQSVDVLRARRLGLVGPMPPPRVHPGRLGRVLDLLRLPPETGPMPPSTRQRRRLLQVKVLISVVVLYFTFNNIPLVPIRSVRSGAMQTTVPQPVLLGELVMIFFFPLIIGAILRSFWVAWGATVALPTIFGLGLWVMDPADRPRALLETGWLVLVTTWFWARAATADYWRRKPEEVPSWRNPFSRLYFEVTNGEVYRGKGRPD